MKMERLDPVSVFWNILNFTPVGHFDEDGEVESSKCFFNFSSSFTLVGHFDKDGEFRSSRCFWNFEFYSSWSF